MAFSQFWGLKSKIKALADPVLLRTTAWLTTAVSSVCSHAGSRWDLCVFLCYKDTNPVTGLHCRDLV